MKGKLKLVQRRPRKRRNKKREPKLEQETEPAPVENVLVVKGYKHE
jgi:hypothetical protein